MQLPVRRQPTFWELTNEQGYSIEQVKQHIAALPEADQAVLFYDYRFWARPAQAPPDWDWRVWILKGGRGSGKTWVGANLTCEKAKTTHRMALVGRTAADVRDTMIEGDSGIISVSPPWFKPKYESGKRRVIWPNGSFALCYTADEPSNLRGPQFEFAWADELAAWRKLKEAWDNLQFGLRLGRCPQLVVTTTPRPLQIIKDLIKRPTTHVTTESTYANAHNLAEQWASQVITQYAGTRLGRQELEGDILDDNPNALWTRELIDDLRVQKYPDLHRVVVAVDPPSSDDPDEKSAEAGIVVGGIRGKKTDLHSQGYLLDDLSLANARPEQWGRQAVSGYYKYHADKIVAEANNGGAMVRSTIQAIDPSVPVELVYASRGKIIRAEPVSTLYEQRRVHHVEYFSALEDQLCEWEPGMKSPDRLDAVVWLFTELMLGEHIIQQQWSSAVK